MSPSGWPVEFDVVMWVIIYVMAKLVLQVLGPVLFVAQL